MLMVKQLQPLVQMQMQLAQLRLLLVEQRKLSHKVHQHWEIVHQLQHGVQLH